MKTIIKCEVCGHTALEPAIDLGPQPMCDDLVPIGRSETPKYYPLEILGCPNCYTFHQKYQVSKELLFPESYHYRAALTKDVLAGMKDLVDDVAGHLGSLEDKQVLDVGCNDGSLLSFFAAKGARTFGIEPTGAFKDTAGKIDDGLNQYFDEAAVDAYLERAERPDVITFTNVFAHIEDLDGLITQLLRLMRDDTILVVENHYLGAVSKLKQFDTFYHEHPRTYSMRSFEFIAKSLGRRIENVSFPARYNGNIRIFIGKGVARKLPALDEAKDYAEVFNLEADVSEAKVRLQDRLSKLAALHGPLPAKAFPGRACINVHCFGLDDTMIDATYERLGSPKIGYYVPGTKIEIRDENEFFETRLDSPVLINFAWHIREEVERYMRGAGYKGEIVDAWITS